jgi:hypothetical protein
MAVILDNPDTILVFNMRRQLMAIALEIRGLKHSKGSVCAFVKKTYNIKKRKKVDVYREFHAMIIQKEKDLNIPERPLNDTEKDFGGGECLNGNKPLSLHECINAKPPSAV